jgi:hypothetical protein
MCVAGVNCGFAGKEGGWQKREAGNSGNGKSSSCHSNITMTYCYEELVAFCLPHPLSSLPKTLTLLLPLYYNHQA